MSIDVFHGSAGHRSVDDDSRLMAQQAAMSWYGWGSPIGLGIALVAIGAAAILLRHAILG